MRVGLLTSGGDCQGLNAALRGVSKTLYEYYRDDIEIYGILDGYRGLIYEEYQMMRPGDFSGILSLGGTILGTSRQPFKSIIRSDDDFDKVEAMKATYEKLGLDALVVAGGNGTHKTANLLRKNGLNIVSLPKTIDNDLWGTEMTFGFQSAVDIATNVLDYIHTTATSHGRVFIVELMGHSAGWLTLHAGIAGGADVILIPEIPYQVNSIVRVIQEREAIGKEFSIIAMAEGALSREEARMSKKELKEKRGNQVFPSVAYQLANELKKTMEVDLRVTVPGHYQRGGPPCPADRVLATRLGAFAAQLIIDKEFGNMVGVKKNKITAIPIEQVAGKLKLVDPRSEIVQSTKALGISFGD